MSGGVMVGHTAEGDPFTGEFDLDMFAEPGGAAVARGEPIATPVPAAEGIELDSRVRKFAQAGASEGSLGAQDADEASGTGVEPGDVETPEITQMLIDALRAEMAHDLAEVVVQLGQLREGLEVLKVLRDPVARDDLTIAALDVLADIESSLAHRAAVYARGPVDVPPLVLHGEQGADGPGVEEALA